MPFFVKWPAKLPAGKVYGKPVIQLDILPTALAAADELRPDLEFDGVNLLSHLDGTSAGPPHDSLYWKLGRQMAVRDGDWKLVRYDPVVDGETGQPTKMRLYNLAEDIGEERDLSAENEPKFEQLRQDWERWNAKNMRPAWGDNKGKKGKKNKARRQRRAAQAAE